MKYFVIASEGTSGNEVLYRRADDTTAPLRVLLPGFSSDYNLFECKDDKLYYATNRDAANFVVRRLDLNDPTDDIVLIPEQRNALDGVGTAGGQLFLTYLEDARSKVCQYDLDGRLVREVALPALGTASGFHAKEEATELYYTLSTFTAPATIYRYDLATGESTLYRAPQVNFDPERYTTEQVFYPSKDGTRVPMFLSYRKDLKRNGKNPCYLYAYGGFQINLTPGFNPSAVLLMEQGRHLRRRQSARRFGVRRGVAQGRHAAQQAERLRRLHRGRGVAHRKPLHLDRKARHRRRLERRTAGGCLRGAATRPVRRLPARRGGDGHAALP